MASIAIVDDHKLFCRSLEVMVNRFKGFSVLFTASDGLDFINKLQKQIRTPDIVIMDQFMPIMDGAATILWLREHFPEISVVALSINYNENAVLNMARNGVKAFLLKDADLSEFKDALEVVSKGGHYYPNYVTRYLLKGVSRTEDEINFDPRELKQIEVDFLRLVSTELTYKEIADAMNVSPRTVDGYRQQLFEKLGLKSRVGLVLYAVRNRIIET
ncbi:MAG: response regulator transcription factor [Bacteroidetes bacterium]|nr:response regulator transcription factor [Bacteroidota bacterium]